MNKAKSGIPALDRALGGGFERGSLILLKEGTGAPVDRLCGAFLEAGLESGEYCYVLGATHSPRRIVESLPYIQKHIDGGKLRLIDGYTNAGGWKEMKSNEKVSTEITEFDKVHKALREAAADIKPGSPVRGVVDSISTLMWSNDELEVDMKDMEGYTLGFFQHQSVMHKKFNMCSIYVIQPEAHEKEPLAMYEHLADYVLELYRTKEKGCRRTVLAVEKVPSGEPPDHDYFFKASPKLYIRRR